MRVTIARIPLIAGCALVASAPAARAATFCVNSQATFQTALTTAQSNGDASNTIRVVAGAYNLSSGLAYSSSTISALNVIGGYNAGCVTLTGEATQLNGQGTVRPLFIVANNAQIRVEGFDFVQGLSTNNRGGGLLVLSTNGDISVRYNRFIANRADDFAGALNIGAGATVRVTNNLFVGNTAAVDGAIEITNNGGLVYFTNNTVTNNTSESAQSAGGLRIGGDASFSLSNNILWNNTAGGASDLFSTASFLASNNDIGVMAGTPPIVGSANNVSVDPRFEACGFLCLGFELSGQSTLIDAGLGAPPGALDTRDLLNRPRVQGNAVDIGATESTPVFKDGFEN